MNQWRKGPVSWNIGKTLYLSVIFSWDMPNARLLAAKHGGPVIWGGPAARIAGLESTICPVTPINFHNPLATFTTRGCPNGCGFCIVPKIEGEFRELDDWEPRPVICDNNFLASSRKHFDLVIDRLKGFEFVDFNQGLDARLFTSHHAGRLGELRRVKIRFAFDSIRLESRVRDAFDLAKSHGYRDFGCYVLIGFNDTPEEAIYKLETVRGWGILPNPMRYQPIDAEQKNSYVAPGWTDFELKRVMRYYSRLIWLGHVPFADYKLEEEALFRT